MTQHLFALAVLALTSSCAFAGVKNPPVGGKNPDDALTDTPPCPNIRESTCTTRRCCNLTGITPDSSLWQAYTFIDTRGQLTGTTGSTFYCCKEKNTYRGACSGSTNCSITDNCFTNGDSGPLTDSQCRNENGLCGA